MADTFGLSFTPGQPQNGQQSGQQGGQPRGNVSPVQQAIQTLSLRIPRVVGAGGLAPQALLTAQGGSALGNPNSASVLEEIRRRLFGPAPTATPGTYTPPNPPPYVPTPSWNPPTLSPSPTRPSYPPPYPSSPNRPTDYSPPQSIPIPRIDPSDVGNPPRPGPIVEGPASPPDFGQDPTPPPAPAPTLPIGGFERQPGGRFEVFVNGSTVRCGRSR
jgi:hypothetical protein